MRKFTTKANEVCAKVSFVGLLFFFFQFQIQAATITWEGTQSTDWFTAANWDGGAVPGAIDNVIIPAGTDFSPILEGLATVMNVRVFPNASLTIAPDAELVIEGVVGGFLNSGNSTATMGWLPLRFLCCHC